MKRSEMIEILENSIYKNCDYSLGEDFGVIIIVHNILSDLENAGMLPPCISCYRRGRFCGQMECHNIWSDEKEEVK